MVWKRNKRVTSPPQPLPSTTTVRTSKTAMDRFSGYFPHTLGSGGGENLLPGIGSIRR